MSRGKRRRRGACKRTGESLEARLLLSGVDCGVALSSDALEGGHFLHRMYQLPPGQSPPPEPRFVDSGEQWPQPNGPGSPLTLTYSYSNLPDGQLGGGLSSAQLRAAAEEAMGLWASVAPLHFVETADAGPLPTPSDDNYSPSGVPQIRIGHHSIDGPSNALAHASYPELAGQGGDVHFDSDEFWSTDPGRGVDLIEVMVHELGHALGLGHENGVAAIMNAAYAGHYNGPGSSFLFSDDAAGVTAIYGDGRGSVTPLSPVDAADDSYTMPEDGVLDVAASDVLAPLGDVWSYLDDGSNLGTSWRSPSFDDSPWPSGNAPLGYGDGDETTAVGFGNNSNNKFVTTYFRQAFNVADASRYQKLQLTIYRDDGAAVYLNGVELARDNLPAGASFSTLATGTAGDDGNQGLTFDVDLSALPAGALRSGTNVVAVEIHQADRASSDISFDLQLVASADDASVLANDNSGDGRPLTAVLHTPPANGTLTLNADGSFRYTPNRDFFGRDTFLYRANNGENNSNVAVVSIDVLPSDDPPRGVDDIYYPPEDATLRIGPELDVQIETWIDAESDWRYLDDGSNQAVAWREAGFDDFSWPQGAAPLGYGDNDENTVVDFGGNANQKHVTTYFRREFSAPNAQDIASLEILLQRDDGAAVYLNGVEIVRDNLLDSAGFETLAQNTLGGSQEDEYASFRIDVGSLPLDTLINGRNVLAVEIHQAERDSSDISFDLVLNARRAASPLANDVEPDGEPLIAFLETGPSHGQVQFDADGSFEYRPEPDYDGEDLFTYRISDGRGETLWDFGSDWRYLDNGSNPGPEWQSPSYDDSRWREGPAQLGYGDGDEQTTVRFRTTNENNKFATTYFRTRLEVDDPASVTAISAALLRDDAAAVYLNGVEVYRDSQLTANAAYDRYASGSNGENAVDTFSIASGLLLAGTNTLAVEVHQDSPTSSDVSFDLELRFNVGGGIATPVSFGSAWSYLDDGSDQGTQWRMPAFDDALWARGFGPFGYGDDDETTVVRGSGDQDFKFATTYFRTTLQLNALDYPAYGVNLLRDDAAAVYINGQEVYRDRSLPPDADFQRFSGVNVPNEAEPVTFGLSPGVWRSGTNWIAVEVHQADGASSDLSFDLQLVGLVGATDPIEVLLNVVPQNDRPRAFDDAYQTAANAPLAVGSSNGVARNDQDPDGDALQVVLRSQPQHGDLALNPNGSFNYTPDLGFVGVDQFQYVLDDQQTTTLIRPGSHWRYLDDGSDQGQSWSAPNFDDSTWNESAAQFGYGDDDEATVVSFGADPDNKFPTTYFRHTFEVAAANQVRSLAASLVRDDAAAVYLNGVAIYRDGNLSAAAAFDTPASSSINDPRGRLFLEFPVDSQLLAEGKNVLAVEVHQSSATSSDLSFDFQLHGRFYSPAATVMITVAQANEPPTVESVTINAGLTDPANLPSGPQPTNWKTQRSDIRRLTITFSEPVIVEASDLRLVNLGVDAPSEIDQLISLSPAQVSTDGNVLTITFDDRELPEGVYALEILSSVTDLLGASLDGDGAGGPAESFYLRGDPQNLFYVLRAEFNADQGVSIFDFPTFSYWFGQTVGVAPSYADMNGDNGVSIFDFPAFLANFGRGVVFPAPAAPFSSEVFPAGRDAWERTAPRRWRSRQVEDQTLAEEPRAYDLALLDLLRRRNYGVRRFIAAFAAPTTFA